MWQSSCKHINISLQLVKNFVMTQKCKLASKVPLSFDRNSTLWSSELSGAFISWRSCAPEHQSTSHPCCWPQWRRSFRPGRTSHPLLRGGEDAKGLLWGGGGAGACQRRRQAGKGDQLCQCVFSLISNEAGGCLKLIALTRLSSLFTKWPGKLAIQENSLLGFRMESMTPLLIISRKKGVLSSCYAV